MVIAFGNSIRRPYTVMRVSDEVGLPFHILCAYLMKESAGGQNVFGHDSGMPFEGAGAVTKKKYLAYKSERDSTNPKRMQGVGPMQLTWWEFQDRADALGGCWVPKHNITVGAQILKEYYDKFGRNEHTKVGTAYNGRISYGQQIALDIETWRARLA